MKHVLLPCLLLALAGTLLVGCGQKGPLYLPDSDEAKERSKDRFEL